MAANGPDSTARLAFALTLAGGVLVLVGAVWMFVVGPGTLGWGHMGMMGGMGPGATGAFYWAALAGGVAGGVLSLVGAQRIGAGDSRSGGILAIVGGALALLGMGGFLLGSLLALVGGILALADPAVRGRAA